MKKQKTYPSVNAMLRGTMPRRKADAMIDSISDLQTRQNLDLLAALTKLVDACTANSPSGVTCPDRRVVARARRVAKLHGAVFSRSNSGGETRRH